MTSRTDRTPFYVGEVSTGDWPAALTASTAAVERASQLLARLNWAHKAEHSQEQRTIPVLRDRLDVLLGRFEEAVEFPRLMEAVASDSLMLCSDLLGVLTSSPAP